MFEEKLFSFYKKASVLPNTIFDEIIEAISNEYLDKGDTVIEVGANVGIHTIHFANAVTPDGRVFAFEPYKNNIEALKRRLEDNKIGDTVTLFETALSNYQGETEFKIFKDNPGKCCFKERPFYDTSKMEKIMVKVDYIDNLFQDTIRLEKLKFMKIDAEGADFDILRGAINTINQFRPLIIFEGGRIKENPGKLYNYSPNDFKDFFNRIQYNIYDTFGIKFDYRLWDKPALNDFIAIPNEKKDELEMLLRITALSVLIKHLKTD